MKDDADSCELVEHSPARCPQDDGEVRASQRSHAEPAHVVIERTKGEVSARCDMEEMNFLALNLMHDIVTNQRTVEDARRTYADTAVAFMMHRQADYTERLQFDVSRGNTADRDEPMISEAMLKQTGEKLKDLLGRGGEDPSR